MPKSWYWISAGLLLLWGVGVCLLAVGIPGPSRLYEFVGTLLTLLPVLWDLARKRYVERRLPENASKSFAAWAMGRTQRAFVGYDPAYAVLIALGLTLIALGFAIDLVRDPTPAPLPPPPQAG
jgi:hypothetical protein